VAAHCAGTATTVYRSDRPVQADFYSDCSSHIPCGVGKSVKCSPFLCAATAYGVYLPRNHVAGIAILRLLFAPLWFLQSVLDSSLAIQCDSLRSWLFCWRPLPLRHRPIRL